MVFKIEPSAKDDIQKEIAYYNEKQKGLGEKFHKEVKEAFEYIRKNPFFQKRYDDVRCLPLKKFPAMIHFTVHRESKAIIIRAVINTYRDPEKSRTK